MKVIVKVCKKYEEENIKKHMEICLGKKSKT
jgi:hypothetical protein